MLCIEDSAPGQTRFGASERAADKGRRSPGSMRLERRPEVLNRFERSTPMAGEAELRYLDGDFRVVRPGAFVRCAVTGAPIPLEELKYWSVDLQEAYSSPEAVLQRHYPPRSAGS
jgi:hypothetical protein